MKRAKQITLAMAIGVLTLIAGISFPAMDPAFGATGTITDEAGQVYTSIGAVSTAINSAEEGSTKTFTFAGDIPGGVGHITINKKVNVVLQTGAEAATANLIIQNFGGADLTVKKGSGDFTITGYIDAKMGNLNVDGITIHSEGYAHGINVQGDANPVTATIKNATITASATGIYHTGNKARIEEMTGCNIKGRHGMEVYRGADIGTIDGCTVEGSLYGIRIQAGNDNSSVFTADNDANIDVDAITNSTIKVVKLSNETTPDTAETHFTALAMTSWSFGETNVHVGTIDNCTISTDATHSYKGALGMYSYSDMKNKPARGKVSVDNISNCTIDGLEGSCGVFIQASDVGTMKDNVVHAKKNGSAVAMTICAYVRMNDPNVTKHACSHVGLISGGRYVAEGPTNGSALYATSTADDTPLIGKIENAYFDGAASGIKLYGYTGNVGDIEDTTIKQTYPLQMKPYTNYRPDYGALIVMGSSGDDPDHIHIGHIRRCTIESETYGIYLGDTNTIAGIEEGTSIAANRECIYNRAGEIGYIKDVSMEAMEGIHQDSTGDGIGICNIGNIGPVTDTSITTHGGLGIYQAATIVQIGGENVIMGNLGEVKNVTIKDVSENGGNTGIFSYEAENPLPLFEGCTIENYTTGIRNFTFIDTIRDNTITNITRGIDTSAEMLAFYENPRWPGSVSTLAGNTVKADQEAIRVIEGGEIGEISSGWHENLGKGSEATNKGLSIKSKGKVGTVSGGTFIGATDAVFIDEGSLNTIIGNDEEAPVFFGQDGYAINNETEIEKIDIEPNLDSETMGYARYLGTKERQIFNVPAKDIYPVHDRDGETYFMSEIATDNAVAGLEGNKFHFLTVYVYLTYDKNAEDAAGDMTAEAEKVEAGTQVTVADNLFERPTYTFQYWDTDPAGSGRSAMTPASANGSRAKGAPAKIQAAGRAFDPGDTLLLMEDTILYAQWVKPTTPVMDPEKDPTPGKPGKRQPVTADEALLGAALLTVLSTGALLARRGRQRGKQR